MESLRIAHVDAEKGFSGGEVQVFLLMEGLRERGHGGVLICPPASRAEAEARSRGLETIAVRMSGDLDLGAVPKLKRALESWKPDLVHLHTARATWLGGLAAKLAKVPAITTRRMDKPLKRGWRQRLIYDSLVERAVAISPAVGSQLREGGVPEAKLSTIPSTVAPRDDDPTARQRLRRSLEAGDGTIVLLALASLIHRKGLDVLIDALAKIREVDLVAWIAGDGPERAALEAQSERLGLAPRVRFLGRREDPEALLAACDVFVLPSRQEGLGVAVLQAMATGSTGRRLPCRRSRRRGDRPLRRARGRRRSRAGDRSAVPRSEAAAGARIRRSGPRPRALPPLADGRRVRKTVSRGPRGARMTSRPKLSACIVAMDEEDRIGDCLDSVAFCDEIVVVDSHSKDRTREIAAAKGAKVIERDWPGHVAQKEFAIRAAAHDW
jgi:hypothetical protein